MPSASTVANIVSRLTREWSRRSSWIARPRGSFADVSRNHMGIAVMTKGTRLDMIFL